MGTTRSGWCLRPYNEGSAAQHAGCPKNFATGGTCSCECSHPNARERQAEDGNWFKGPDTGSKAPKPRRSPRADVEEEVVGDRQDEEDADSDGPAVDNVAVRVYAKRVPTATGAKSLLELRSNHEGILNTSKPEPRKGQRRASGGTASEGRGPLVSQR